MAKLFKNAVISPEVTYLTAHESVLNLNQDPVLDSTQPSINEEQLKAMQNEAYQQGYISGKEAGKTLIEEQITLLKKQLEAALLAIPQAIAQNRLELSNEIANIVLHITQQFFLEKESNPKALKLQINQLLKQLNNKQSIELYLHPKEIDILQKGLVQLDANHLNGLKIKSNDSLILGGYVIKTEHGMFDASIEKQIDRLKDLLLQLRKRGLHAPLD
ncbi:FliH/SctL family protein [Legionella maioricensis]|uniref:Flagellar assembly protein FliH n=1 Tax=Legionella maioricensis TaxID=2896528 RepID=A0A9X2CXP5_9GAMM|nr:FliH/SctL family protein [Legionella maioricensis]MCL9682634.1 hypothetical protein [Legionella maioricensis]MCL9687319.1 hypothetical protein [Legionella maioricensis]